MTLMKRWSAVLGFVGGAMLGAPLLGGMMALALPMEQVVRRLQPIPVFTVVDDKGAPLMASVPGQNGQNIGVVGVFISQGDAQRFITTVKQENPQLGNQVQILPVSLAEVYRLAEQGQNPANPITFEYVPEQTQVQEAVKLEPQFRGTPLFVARGGQNQGYLTIQQNNQQLIPFFFEKAQADGLVQQFRQQQPSQAGTVEVKVVSLEGLLNTLKTSEDTQLNQIVLVPTQEAQALIRSQAQQSSGTPSR